MFGIDSSELLVIVIVALLVIGPKDLPRVLYKVGKFVGQARGMARHFRTGLDAMVREAELEELQKEWAKENERIIAHNPMSDIAAEMKPLADEVAGVLTSPPPEMASLDAPPAPMQAPAPAPAPADADADASPDALPLPEPQPAPVESEPAAAELPAQPKDGAAA